MLDKKILLVGMLALLLLITPQLYIGYADDSKDGDDSSKDSDDDSSKDKSNGNYSSKDGDDNDDDSKDKDNDDSSKDKDDDSSKDGDDNDDSSKDDSNDYSSKNDNNNSKDDNSKDKDKDSRKAYAVSFGVAVDNENNTHPSYMLLFLNTDSDESEYKVKRGFSIIKFSNERASYIIIPESWSIIINSTGFFAEGDVKGKDGNEYTLTLEGELLEDTDLGKFYMVNGRLDDKYTIDYMLKVAEWKH